MPLHLVQLGERVDLVEAPDEGTARAFVQRKTKDDAYLSQDAALCTELKIPAAGGVVWTGRAEAAEGGKAEAKGGKSA